MAVPNRESGAGHPTGLLPAARSDIPKEKDFQSKVICLFIGLSGKRLLLENTHNKNGSSNKGRPPDREETLHKELGQLRRLGRRSFKKDKRLRPRQRRGFFIFYLFADANQRSGDRKFSSIILVDYSPLHRHAASVQPKPIRSTDLNHGAARLYGGACQ